MKERLKPLAAALALLGSFFVALGIPMAVARPVDLCDGASWHTTAESSCGISSRRERIDQSGDNPPLHSSSKGRLADGTLVIMSIGRG